MKSARGHAPSDDGGDQSSLRSLTKGQRREVRNAAQGALVDLWFKAVAESTPADAGQMIDAAGRKP